MNERILIIENQYLQFQQLVDVLPKCGERNLEVFPSGREAYTKLISAIKVFVYDGYPKDYRDRCQDVILDSIICGTPPRSVDLIIMDYKLGGSMKCKTGVDLALMIWRYFPNVPILFLSRVDYAVRERFLQVESVNRQYRKDWLMKGFMGAETLDETFIKHTVYNKIVGLLDQVDVQIIGENEWFVEKVRKISGLPVGMSEDQAKWDRLLAYMTDPSKPSLPLYFKRALEEQDERTFSPDEAVEQFITLYC